MICRIVTFVAVLICIAGIGNAQVPARFSQRSLIDRATYLAHADSWSDDPLPLHGRISTFGQSRAAVTAGRKEELRKANPDLDLDHWGIDEAGRAVLLLNAAASMSADDYERVVLQCYEFGDSREQQ